MTNLITNAQENNHWLFGSNGLGVHFDQGGMPTLTYDTYTPYGWAGCGVLNNYVNGNLVFYTDGQVVVDRTHLVMPNGDDLNGGNSTHSTGKICARPGHPGQYYVFSINTSTETSFIDNLYYSIVDTTLVGNGSVANPLGDVVSGEKNNLLNSYVSESLELIAGDGDYYWLISPKFYDATIDIFLIDENGISLDNSFDYNIEMQDVQAIRYSKVNNKLALGSYGEDDPILIFDFDHINGNLSGLHEVPGNFGTSSNQYSGITDLEWSPNGTKLYISKYRGNTPVSGGKLFQYDLDNPDENAVLIHQISATNSYTSKGLRLGPDGIIYWLYVNTNPGSIEYIAGILDPDEAGTNCNLQLQYLTCDVELNVTGLFPNMALEFKPESVTVKESNINIPTLRCFPQPAVDEINLSIDAQLNFKEIHFEITDMSGKLVYNKKFRRFNNAINIETTNYLPGMYLVKVYSEDFVTTTKFIKI